MNIVIYEDKFIHRKFLMNAVRESIQNGHNNACLILATENEKEIEQYINKNHTFTLYFLDILDKNGRNTGFMLSEKIRQKNNSDIVVFVTQYLREVMYSVSHKMIALNIITKQYEYAADEIDKTIDYVYKSIPNKKSLSIERANEILIIDFNDIYMIEAVKERRRIQIHYYDYVYVCSGLLKDVMQKLDKRFKRCHKSYIVNSDKIEYINKNSREIKLKNGRCCYYSRRFKIDKEF